MFQGKQNNANLTLFFNLNFLILFACKINPEANVKTMNCLLNVCKGKAVVEMCFVIEGVLQPVELSSCSIS